MKLTLVFLIPLLAGCGITRREVVYTPPTRPTALKADVVKQRGAAAAPAVLLIHGGAWHMRDNRWHMRGLARKLAARGYVVVNATYRGTPRFRHPAALEDMSDALCWMRGHAAAEGINPDRIAVWGYSSGAHLAALVGMNPRNHVKAIVAGAGPMDLTLYQDEPLVPTYLGAVGREIPAKFRAASPVHRFHPDCPPVFLYHGTADKLVPPVHSVSMLAVCRKSGVPCELYLVSGKGHIATFLMGNTAVARAMDFLDEILRPSEVNPAGVSRSR